MEHRVCQNLSPEVVLNLVGAINPARVRLTRRLARVALLYLNRFYSVGRSRWELVKIKPKDWVARGRYLGEHIAMLCALVGLPWLKKALKRCTRVAKISQQRPGTSCRMLITPPKRKTSHHVPQGTFAATCGATRRILQRLNIRSVKFLIKYPSPRSPPSSTRKIQLQRPWQSAKSTDEDAVHRHIWEASRDKNSDARRRGGRQQQRRSHSGVPAATPARPSTSRSGYSKRRLLFRSASSGSLMAQRNRRRRPSTGSSWSPSQERVTQSPSTWTTTSCLSLSGRGIGASSSSDFKVVCWDGTTLAPTGAAALFAAKSSLDRSSLPSEQPDSAVGAATVATEATGRDSVALRTGDATPHCSFRANPFDPDKADIVAEAPLNNNTPTSPVIRQQKDKKAAVKSGRVDISGETVDLLPPADSSSGAPATRSGRPASAGSSSGHRSRHGNFYHTCMSRENQIDRPQSARASSSTWSTCFSVEEYSPAVGDEGQEVESTGGRISVAVTLPLLIEVDDTDEAR